MRKDFIFLRESDQFRDSTVTTALTFSDLLEVSQSTNVSTLSEPDGLKFAKGYYLPLSVGEKVIGRLLTDGEATMSNTNTLGESADCSLLGVAKQYLIDPFDFKGRIDGEFFRELPGGGMTPDPVAFIVDLTDYSDPDAEQVIESGVCTGPKCFNVPAQDMGDRRRVYWYNNEDQN